MCQMRVVVLKEMLGNREICWSLWNGREVMELTSKQIKDTIKAGHKVCGLMIGTSGELELDKEGFYCNNIMEHRHSASYKPMVEENCMANMFYIVIGKEVVNSETVYNCISTKWEQAKILEADLRAYLKIGVVSAGAKLVDDKIVLADLEFPKKEEKKPDKPVEAPKVADKPMEAKKEGVKAEVKPASKEAGKK